MKVLKFLEPLFGVLIGAILFLVGIGILSVVVGLTVKVTTRSYDAVREEVQRYQPPPRPFVYEGSVIELMDELEEGMRKDSVSSKLEAYSLEDSIPQ